MLLLFYHVLYCVIAVLLCTLLFYFVYFLIVSVCSYLSLCVRDHREDMLLGGLSVQFQGYPLLVLGAKSPYMGKRLLFQQVPWRRAHVAKFVSSAGYFHVPLLLIVPL